MMLPQELIRKKRDGQSLTRLKCERLPRDLANPGTAGPVQEVTPR